MKGCPKLQHYWNLTIRLISVISRTLVGRGGGLTPLQRCSQCILQPLPTGQTNICIYSEWPMNQRVSSNLNKEIIPHMSIFLFSQKLDIENKATAVLILKTSCVFPPHHPMISHHWNNSHWYYIIEGCRIDWTKYSIKTMTKISSVVQTTLEIHHF